MSYFFKDEDRIVVPKTYQNLLHLYKNINYSYL